MKKYDFGEWLMYSHIDDILKPREERDITVLVVTTVVALALIVVLAEQTGLVDYLISLI